MHSAVKAGPVLLTGPAFTAHEERRLHLIIPFDREKQDYVDYSTLRLFAAVYPEDVTLAPLIASSYWRRLADGSETEQARFFAEVATRVSSAAAAAGTRAARSSSTAV